MTYDLNTHRWNYGQLPAVIKTNAPLHGLPKSVVIYIGTTEMEVPQFKRYNNDLFGNHILGLVTFTLIVFAIHFALLVFKYNLPILHKRRDS